MTQMVTEHRAAGVVGLQGDYSSPIRANQMTALLSPIVRCDGIRGSRISQDARQFAANTLPIVASIKKAVISTYSCIAKALNDRGIPTARGTSWYAATVKNLSAHSAAQ